MSYDFSMSTVEQPAWPHAARLRELRGPLSVDKAARRIDVTRQTWSAWEKGAQVPSHDSLRAIVDEFDCPPELVGYEPPRGWELVPAEWIRSIAADLDGRLARIEECLCEEVGTVKSLEEQVVSYLKNL